MSDGGQVTTTQSDAGKRPATSALANIQYASIVDSDGGTPSEDEMAESPDFPEDARSVVGVSISRAQTHIASPKTPAAEKAAAMEERGGFFNDRYDLQGAPGVDPPRRDVSATIPEIRTLEHSDKPTEPNQEQTAKLPDYDKSSDKPESSPQDLPSPWRAGLKAFQQSDETSGTLRYGFGGGRQRSASGPEGGRMRFSFNLPSVSLPKGVPFFGSGSDEHQQPSKDVALPRRRDVCNSRLIPQNDGAPWEKETLGELATRAGRHLTQPEKEDDSDASLTPSEQVSSTPRPQVQHEPRPQHSRQATSSSLRRTTSADSLFLHRTLSRASSLGDDSRFEHVSEQINSRFKAIKDSFQDTNFRLTLPRPPSLFSSSRETLFPSGEKQRSSSLRVRRSLVPYRDSSQDLSSSPEPQHHATFPISSQKHTAGMTAVNAAAHPYFAKALEDLTGDLVILGGYRGSILREAMPPHRRMWVPLKVGLNLRKVDLEVGLDPEDEERMPEKIISTGMLTHIGPVDMTRRLFKRLRACENAENGKLRIHDYGYDWRLSPHRLSGELIRFLEKLSSNAPGTPTEQRGAIVIAHSLGGLITRHAVNQRPDLFAGVVYAGVPQTCINILGPLRNGDDVLLSSRVLTAQVNFTIRTSFALLPPDGKCFVDKDTKEEYPVDFFDIKNWIEYRFSPCINPPLPPLSSQPTGRLSSLIGFATGAIPESVTNALPSFPFTGKRTSQSSRTDQAAKDHLVSSATTVHATAHAEGGAANAGIAPQMGGQQHQNPAERGQSQQANVATAVTIPRPKAIEYLTRTLAETKKFREDLAFIPTHQSSNLYPPAAVIYGKSEPTVYAAKVHGRDGIKRADAYDDLAFASGDGVVLARAAMLPEGYKAVRGGVVASERGHVTLLGDLEAVGRCLNAVVAARKAGIGLGKKEEISIVVK